MTKIFLQAEWRKLAMANYAVDKRVLMGYVPNRTELDLWNDTCYVSLVGFMFLNTRLKGFRIPFHTDFEEVNLRFYVRYRENNEWRRGVVFIREIVPKPALALVANSIYKERYETMKMGHSWEEGPGNNMRVEYRWKKQRWNSISMAAERTGMAITSGSEEEFITEHYWGYTAVNEQRTSEYRVEHPQWQVYGVRDYAVDVDFGNVYGTDFNFLTNEKPSSVFLAEGSEIVVRQGRRL